jgi:glutamate-1-semialdehyde 2,1-aminomutase
MSRSENLYSTAIDILPGGVNSPVRAFKSVGGTPLFIESGKGSWIKDVDGNSYFDFLSSWGPLILGHGNSKVLEAVTEAMQHGFSFGAPNPYEVELAQKVVNYLPSIEKVRFVNSGTEAVMSALRVARAYTKKNRIIKFDGCYHGHSDNMLVSAGSGLFAEPSSAGVTKNALQDTLSIPYNNRKALEEAFKQFDDIAAVIVEPVAGNMGVVLPADGYLEFLRDITTKNGSLLIFDEVITGFRLSLGGAQQLFNITPDLTTMGKIIGGGFPVGAFGGKKEIMDLVAPMGSVYQAGTLSGNPVTMAAGLATIKELEKPGFYNKLNCKADKFILELKQEVESLPIVINNIGSMFTIFFSENKIDSYNSANSQNAKLFSIFFHKLLENGIYIAPSPVEALFVSSAMTDSELAKCKETISLILKEILS